ARLRLLLSDGPAARQATNELPAVASLLDTPEDDRRVVTAEAERVRDGDAHVGVARLVRDVVEVALGVRHLIVDRRRHLAVADREGREDGLDCSTGAETVAGRALRRRDRRLARLLLAERELDHTRLRRV